MPNNRVNSPKSNKASKPETMNVSPSQKNAKQRQIAAEHFLNSNSPNKYGKIQELCGNKESSSPPKQVRKNYLKYIKGATFAKSKRDFDKFNQLKQANNPGPGEYEPDEGGFYANASERSGS